MRPVSWGRLLTAMVTPYDQNLRVDYKRAAELSVMLLQTGTDAIVVGGTTGESPVLSHEEKVRLFETVVEAVANRAPVIAGTGTNNTQESVRLSSEAQSAGVDGIMLVAPYYNKPPQDGLFAHFAEVAQKVQLPVLLYNVPPRTAVNVSPKTVGRLAALPNIVAIKEAAGSIDQFTEIRRCVPEDMLIYSGDDSMTLPALSVGSHGVVSVVSHVAGPYIKKMIECYAAGDVNAAADWHSRLFPLFKAAFVTTNPIPIKAALEMVGFDVGGIRLPLSPLSAEHTAILRKALVSIGIIDS